ncbi:uncharacterized protein LOC120433251 [Oreochromis aureus]|uniref:uncharacterized protein LOC120433251 n=1 Tax=Oreochromis aureus TaxID=47969 RepID=UPI001952DDA1|nr:uncharacterized protein LOC120433251 [Oreochromis aureus]
MGKENNTVIVKLEPGFPLNIEAKKQFPRMSTVKSKKRIKTITTDSRSTTDKDGTTCEISGNIMRLCVNLMPVLTLAKETEQEEEDEKEESNISMSRQETETSSRDPSVSKLVERKQNAIDLQSGLTSERTTKASLSLTSPFLPPPISEPKPVHQQATTSSAKLGAEGFGGSGAVTVHASDIRPWIDNALFSKSRSAEVQLPDITLSSLNALLQTVTYRLRKKRRGAEEGPRRQDRSDQLLVAFTDQSSVGQQDGKRGSVRAGKDRSPGACRVNRQMSLPPLHPAPKAPLIFLRMVQPNHLTAQTPQ